MQSEVRFEKECLPVRLLEFKDLRDGEGVFDDVGCLRLRISDYSYLHFSVERETLGRDDCANWPPDFKAVGAIRKFKLVAEEIA